MEKMNQSAKENITARLKSLGLSTYAAKTYVALLSLPSSSAGTLCSVTGIPDSKMYYALDELAKKGMVTVQGGTPNIYRPVHPKEAISNLIQQFTENLKQTIMQAENLADSLSPMFERVEHKEEIELAYVIRGRRNIINKMKELITSAKSEAVVFVSEEELLNELESPIREAETKAEVKFAVSKELEKTAKLKGIDQPKTLKCYCNVVISDMKTLITTSSWRAEIAIMTNDKGLMSMSRDYYDNPKCCLNIP